MVRIARLFPGLLVVGVLSAAALALGAATTAPGFPVPVGPLTLAVVLGAVATNLVPKSPAVVPGVKFVSRRVLRLAIVLLGFRLSLAQVAAVGPQAVVLVLAGSGLTFGFTLVLGRLLKLPASRALLLASGTSVCGAAAIAAVDGCVRAPEEDVGFALAAITLFGTLAIVLYPILKAALGLPSNFYAFWTGASVHEVAQVAAAASVLPPAGQALASTVKLLRVLLILPLTLGLSLVPRGSRPTIRPKAVTVPWFALAFFAVCVVFSFPILSPGLRGVFLKIDDVLLTAAMAALGWEIHRTRFKTLNLRTVWLGLLPTLFLAVVSAVLVSVLCR